VDINYALAAAVADYMYDTHFPAGSVVELRTGFPPGPDNAATGLVLGSITSPASPWAAADAGTGLKAKAGVWSTTSSAAGVIGYYRFRNAASTRVEEGIVSVTGGGGDATVNDLTVGSVGVPITLINFTKRLVRH
jgi:hypothetical protein